MRIRIKKFFFEIAESMNPDKSSTHYLWKYNRTTFVYYIPYRETGLRLVLAWDEPKVMPWFRLQWRWE